MSVASCPICRAPNGFHEESQHGKLPVDYQLPKVIQDLHRNPECNCGEPFESAGAPYCRHPAHQKFRSAK